MPGGLKPVRIAAVCASAYLCTGCLFWNHVIIPPEPVNGGGPDPSGVAYEHDVEIGWKFAELKLLDSLQVQYPAPVTVIETPQSDELSIQLQLFIEKDHHDAFAQTYLDQILAASKLSSQDAQFNVPAPQQPCQEVFDPHGNLTSLEGICDRELTVVIPKSHPVPLNIQPGGDFNASGLDIPGLQLTLVDGTDSEVSKFSGDLRVSGGGAKATLVIDTANTVDLELDAVEKAELRHIGGRIHISLAHPDPNHPNAVTLDGTPITSFPFDRP